MDTQYILVVDGVALEGKPMPLLTAEKWRSAIKSNDVRIIPAGDAALAQRERAYQLLGWQFGPTAQEAQAAERSTRAQYSTAPDALMAAREIIRMLRSDLAESSKNAGNPDVIRAA